MPVAASPATSAATNPIDGLGVGQAEQVADAALVDVVGCRRQQLIEHRFRIAHAARGESGDEADRGRIGRPTVRLQDAGELALDLGHRQPADVVALQAGEDGGREARRFGRGEHERHEVRRLLERLQQGVPGVLGDLVRLVEDVDLALQLARWIRQSLTELAHGIDAAIARGVDLDQVQRRPFADRHARRTDIACVAVAQVGAVEGLCEDPGERRLAGPARTDEEDGVCDATRPDGVPQRLDDRLLTDDLTEGLGTPAAVDGLMRDG